MAKSKKTSEDTAVLQPDEINALRALVKEFIEKVTYIDNEIETLKLDRKELLDEYKEKLDVKTLNQALRVVKIQSEVERKDTFDLFIETLTDPAQ